jgi:hypothetical protein
MDIVVGKIQSAKEEGTHKKSFYKDGKKSSSKERRKSKQDRRKSVREGVIVSLSFKNDRRLLPDRRKANPKNYTYTIKMTSL